MAGRDFLLEIGSEELPARFGPPALAQLAEDFARTMASWRLEHGAIRALGTPRRLAILVSELSERQPDQRATVQGPPRAACFDKEGNPSRALLGFAQAQGVEPSAVGFVGEGKDERATVEIERTGRPAAEVLAEVLPKLILGLSFPKTMRWGSRRIRYGRPIRWVIALLGDEVVPFALEDIESGRITRGHRFLGERAVTLAEADDYIETLRAQFVLVDPEERRASVRTQVRALAESVGGQPLDEERMLEENLWLVEWPTAFLGSFEGSFLELPAVVPTTVCRKHQKYFPLAGADGRLLPRFIAVRNGDDRGIDKVRAGNEVVVHGRLRDAVFFFGNDLKRSLGDRVEDLERVTFIRGLGSLGQKARRLVSLAEEVSCSLALSSDDAAALGRSALLAKADLTTNLVIEFTELQGIIGGIYAERSGEGPTVATAIAEHYRPAGADDPLPRGLVGALLSVIDKVDTVMGVLSIGEAPTGTADPHGVRRRVQGAAAIVLERALPLDLGELAARALGLYGCGEAAPLALFGDLLRQRTEAVLEADGCALDLRQAVLSLPVERLGQALAVTRALRALEATEPAVLDAAWRAATRPSNIATKRLSDSTSVDTSLLTDPAEAAMLGAVARIEVAADAFDAALAASGLDQRFEAAVAATKAALTAFAGEAEVVDGFFAAVMVMDENPAIQANRLALCWRAARAFARIASLQLLARS